MFERPVLLQNGEYLLPVLFRKRPTPLLGAVASVARARSETEALDLPADPSGLQREQFLPIFWLFRLAYRRPGTPRS